VNNEIPCIGAGLLLPLPCTWDELLIMFFLVGGKAMPLASKYFAFRQLVVLDSLVGTLLVQ
jgi:hypothetical protein